MIRQKIYAAALAAAAFLLMPFTAFPNASIVDTVADPENTAFGGAFSSAPSGRGSEYFNPAGLPESRGNEIEFIYKSSFADTFLTSAGCVLDAKPGKVGLMVSYLNMGAFDEVDENGYLTGLQMYPYALIFAASYGAKLLDFYDDINMNNPVFVLSAGASVKYAYEHGATDFSNMHLGLGATGRIKNIVMTGVSVSRIKLSGHGDVLPELRAGARTRYFQAGPGSMKVGATFITGFDGRPSLAAGVAYNFYNVIELRGGYSMSLGNDIQESADYGLSGGIGIVINGIRIDYAAQSYGTLGTNSVISVTFPI